MYNLPLNAELYGNKDLIEKIKLLISHNSNNAFLIGGPIGVGKANFVYNLSRFLLCNFEDFSKNKKNIFFNDVYINKSSHLFDSNTHPDFFNLSLNTNVDDKKIPIDDVRKLNVFFQKTFSVSNIKIAVINTIDDLSINSLNLLLKTIEEIPINSYIFLISHKPINTLKTITSRCSVFNMNPLNNKDFDVFIKENTKSISKDENLFIKDIASSSPGLALSLYETKILDLYLELLDDLLSSIKYIRIRETILRLISSKSNENNYYMFVLHLIINNLIKKSSFYLLEKKYLETTLEKEKELICLIISKKNTLKLLSLDSKFDKDMHSAGLLNVNKSDIVINMFKDLCSV